jgi:Plasmid pRiA4b ORF-3-like protein
MTTGRRTIYELNVSLRGVDPRIWREVQVRDETTLPELHRILQLLFGWSGSHAHEFALRDQVYGFPSTVHPDGTVLDEKAVPLNRLLVASGDELTYIYDFGDNWRCRVTLDATLTAEEQMFYPRCIDGERQGPPENVGGPYAYSAYVKSIQDVDLCEPLALDQINESLRREFYQSAKRRL